MRWLLLVIENFLDFFADFFCIHKAIVLLS